jgi:hypothetical protein
MGLTNNLGKLSNMITSTGSAVGIAQASPAYTLDVTGTGRFTGALTASSTIYPNLASGFVGYSIFQNGAKLVLSGGTGGIQFNNNANSLGLVIILDSGNVGIGNTGDAGQRLAITGSDATSSNYALVVNNGTPTTMFFIRNDGYMYTGTSALSPYNNTTGNAANMYVSSGGVLFRFSSSLKYKTDVKNYTKGLAEVLQLRPVFYKGKGKNDGDAQFAGLIAEEVQELGLTEFVQYAEDGTPDALAYSNMIALLTKAIQEMNTKFEEQQATITSLQDRLTKGGL